MSENEIRSDRELIKAAQKGDPQAYAALYDRYALAIFRFLYAQTSHRLDAEDLTSEVFLRAWQSLPKYRERGFPFSSFLFSVARNAVIDLRRRVQREERATQQMAEDLPFTADGLDAHWQHQALFQHLSQLSDDYRMVLSLRFISGLSPQEAARVLNRSEGATRVLQYRALAALRKLMET